MEEINTVEQLEKKKTIFRSYQVIWYILGIIEILLGLRVLLRFLAANPTNPFANMIYSLSNIFVYPFATLFRAPAAGGSVLEISTVVAMLVYWLLAYGLIKLLQFAKPVSQEEVVRKVDDPKVQL